MSYISPYNSYYNSNYRGYATYPQAINAYQQPYNAYCASANGTYRERYQREYPYSYPYLPYQLPYPTSQRTGYYPQGTGWWYPGRPLYMTPQVAPVKPAEKPFVWKNRLKELFHNRQAITYALHLRTFAAKDKNGNGKIDPLLGESGNFLRAIPLLSELKELGVNNIHLLPILPPGEIDRLGDFGSPGSVYAPGDYDRLNEEYDEPNNGLSVLQEAKMFIDAAHKLGIHIMMDIPSCASIDLANKRPDLMARDSSGKLLTPTNWIDIRMFVKDSPALREYFQRFFDIMVDKIGVDGFRADVARARTPEFWRHFISKYPDKAWLAETYTEEDASPMNNIPRDIPETLLKAGFDSIYGQFHIFQDFRANQYIDYLKQNQAMLWRAGPYKSIIGSFWTHDDPSTMKQGGPSYCKLISGLMCTQPDTNPYIMDGFTTGFENPNAVFDFNIFDWRPRPAGNHPDIGEFLKHMIAIRKSQQYGPVLTYGKLIPLNIDQDKRDPRVIAFLRQYGGKSLLVVANKDMNAAHRAIINIPRLSKDQKLCNIAPPYGEPSSFLMNNGKLQANLARGRFYLFELDLPTYR